MMTETSAAGSVGLMLYDVDSEDRSRELAAALHAALYGSLGTASLRGEDTDASPSRRRQRGQHNEDRYAHHEHPCPLHLNQGIAASPEVFVSAPTAGLCRTTTAAEKLLASRAVDVPAQPVRVRQPGELLPLSVLVQCFHTTLNDP
ncbi:hypothetical protein GCM10010377_77930 [Streptomyces viridiviolaceus]|nr:hypothetical protein GCM10010377_77930 [Streptomyces viridiviolaceus]